MTYREDFTLRLEIYPHIAELIYRLRNKSREMCQIESLTLEQAVDFLRLSEQYTEQIYSARLYLELDGIFEPLHNFKSHILAAKNSLLDWIYIAREQSLENPAAITQVLGKLNEIYRYLDHLHCRLIRSLTKLAQA